MSEQKNYFKPDTIDTQLDELTHLPSFPGADPDVRTIHALQQIYKSQVAREAQSIERVFNRFVQQAVSKDRSVQDQQEDILSTQTTTLLNDYPLDIPTKIEKTYEGRLPIHKRRYPTIRRAGIAIAAVLAMTLIAGSAISFLLIASAQIGITSNRLTDHPVVQQKPTMMYTIAPIVTPLPQPQTTCPDVGTSRAAILPPLTQKEGQGIVYTAVNINNQSNEDQRLTSYNLERYDVDSGQTTSLLTVNAGNTNANPMSIREANFSANRQWIVLNLTSQGTLNPTSMGMIQLLRADGQYRQTLYCAPAGQSINNPYLSPDMKSLVFAMTPTSVGPPRMTGMYRLDLINGGSIHTLLTQQPGAEMGLVYQPETWIDNNHVLVNMFGSVYVKDAQGVYDNAPGKLMSLDITQGDNQQIAQLPILLDQTNTCQKFDLSPDHSLLVITQCERKVVNNNADWSPTGTLMLKNIVSGTTQTILSRADLPMQSVHMVSNTTILFNVLTPNRSDLWRINNDGTGLTQIVSVTNSIPPIIDPSQNGYDQPYAYISDDGSQYIVVEEGEGGTTYGALIQLNIMSSSGGNLVMVPPQKNQQIINVLGWTEY